MGRYRSTEAPMDFEFTSRSQELPPDSPFRRGLEAAEMSRKRTLSTMASSAPIFPPPDTLHPTGHSSVHNNVPFLFNSPMTPVKTVQHWVPPPNFTPSQAFPPLAQHPEIKDVQMGEVSPPKPVGDEESEKSRPIATGAIRRVFRKRSAREKQRRGRRDGDEETEEETESEDDSSVSRRRRPVKSTSNTNHYTLNLPGPAPHPSDLPYTLAKYTQFAFNISLLGLVLYLLVNFIITLQRDVQYRIAEESLDILQEIAHCTTSYKSNNCVDPLPGLILSCAEWEACMARDPSIVGRTKLGAQLIAEVINSFVEPISWKALIFSLSSVSFFTLFINAILSFYRSKHDSHLQKHAPPPVQHFPGFGYPPPTYSIPSHRDWWPSEARELEQSPSRRRKMLDGEAVKLQ
ncbi:hypothetical protein SISSUDRAFT_1040988 [Sistotremastrum suecicum HHB10207 ss-3]|uniref:Brl1/Brr6 domain-containing protein n=1 Tax=Sistotremastrum suecicum HHB10207 ss-3 TaxID=1314776 RepID=A0A166HI99_9AGAM|nr:hypothetical protein SISSUDRAFT_1040988 [Sistotremastrum suecicum HHB10207 ss-3]